MSAATLKRLLIALASLMLIWLALSFWRSHRKDTLSGFSLPHFDKAKVDALTLIHREDTLSFAKRGTEWTVNGFPTAQNVVEALLDAAADTAAHGEIVGTNRASFADFGVADTSGYRLTLSSAGKEVLQVILGGRSQDDFGGYIRMPKDTMVYQMRGRLTALAGKPLDAWRDRMLLTLVSDSIGAIEVERAGGNYRAARSGAGWTVDGALGDSGAINLAISLTRVLQASGYATSSQSDSANFTKPDRSIKYLGRTGNVLASLAFDSMATGYWVKRDGSPLVYRLEGWVVDGLVPERKTIVER